MRLMILWLATWLSVGIQQVFSQSSTDTSLLLKTTTAKLNDLQKLPSKYLTRVSSKTEKVEHILDRQSGKVLTRLNRIERKIKRKLKGKADQELLSLLNDSSYQGFTKAVLPIKSLQSSAYLDSLQTTFRFLEEHKELLSDSKNKLSKAVKGVNDLEAEFEKAKDIKKFIRGRQELLKQRLTGYSDASKYLQKYNQQAYYYGARIREYKSLLNDRSKIEAKAQVILQKSSLYKDFIKRNSTLASLFNLTSGASSVKLEGLQTRSMVEALLQQRLGGSGIASQVMQQQLQTAQSQLGSQSVVPGLANIRSAVVNQMSAARSRMNELRQNHEDLDNAAEMPNFKPSPLKSKRFWQRIELGGNIQFQRSTKYFPATTDVAAQAAYHFHKNGSVGLGIAYKLGLGSDWSHIHFSHSGVSLRSFVDWKIKNMYYLNGGFDLNRLSIQGVTTNTANWHDWQTSALIGVSRKYQINARLKGNIMVLYDFLAASQIPRSNGLKVRFGYSL
ncbi:hypothetical protein [Chitinophaga sp. CF418]|uniref:hypothetical protein n=1 Tax=Chitinophaga sp. CF418 TaxID=1855287 RepID=UPI0009197919|nr:hypothetical protein [Chitinophaga sp. CF418]SHN34521.1 hypothetical protein SAMN05216311_109300 [Chitinophaga sp. CF418]